MLIVVKVDIMEILILETVKLVPRIVPLVMGLEMTNV